jgi:hypothetical protein
MKRQSVILGTSGDAGRRTGALEGVHTLIASGLQIAWDSKTLEAYRDLAGQSPEDLQAYINHWSDEQDRHNNMDY